jgi:hypothetical protein
MVVGVGAWFLRDHTYLPPAVLIVTAMMTRGLLVCSPSVTLTHFWMILVASRPFLSSVVLVLSLRSVASVALITLIRRLFCSLTILFCHLVLTTDQPRR